MEKFTKLRQNITVPLLVVTFFLLGINIGYNHRPEIDKITGISHKETEVNTEADFSPFWKAWNTINEKSPMAGKITDQERVYGAISGLMGSLHDPYSVFFSPDEKESFESTIDGNFGGVGMEVSLKDRILTVIAPLKGTPAYRAGIKPGDKILKIDKTITSDLKVEDAIKLMRGEKGTSVTLMIFHEGDKEATEIKIVRDIINLPTLDTELRKDGIFVIKLYSFYANSHNLFRDAIKQFAESGSDKLILDLRGNPGGYLESAVDMTSWFLPQGKIIVTEDYGNNKKPKTWRSKGYDIFNEKLKFIILIDNGSASASEILAGAMQDHGKAKLVGSQSFGKGSVQEVVKITPDTLLKITVAKWLTPNGTSISEKGLTPDYSVEITRKNYDSKKDPQLDKAVELLLSEKL